MHPTARALCLLAALTACADPLPRSAAEEPIPEDGGTPPPPEDGGEEVTLEVMPLSLGDAAVGSRYELDLSATGGVAPYSWEIQGHLPDNLVFDPASARITGMPLITMVGEHHIPLAVTDSTHQAPRRAMVERLLTVTSTYPAQAVELSLPLAGRWEVVQGNSTPYSHAGDNQFCWDFRMVDRDGNQTVDGVDPSRPRDYYTYGQPVLAAADGMVVYREDGHPDNELGDNDGESNIIVIRHGPNEEGVQKTIYDHLRAGSLTVQLYDHVTRGQVIGEIGQSGTGRPHLHFSLRISGLGTIPAVFREYWRLEEDGSTTPVTAGVPQEGEIILSGADE